MTTYGGYSLEEKLAGYAYFSLLSYSNIENVKQLYNKATEYTIITKENLYDKSDPS